jgi:hypothetical protein
MSAEGDVYAAIEVNLNTFQLVLRVYRSSVGLWTPEFLTPITVTYGVVSLSGNGKTIALPQDNSINVYEYVDQIWDNPRYITNVTWNYVSQIQISDDGNTIVAFIRDVASIWHLYVFTKNQDLTWNTEELNPPPDSNVFTVFNVDSCAISKDGLRIFASADDQSSYPTIQNLWSYSRTNNTWGLPEFYVSPGTVRVESTTVSYDGQFVALFVGNIYTNPREGYLYVYENGTLTKNITYPWVVNQYPAGSAQISYDGSLVLVTRITGKILVTSTSQITIFDDASGFPLPTGSINSTATRIVSPYYDLANSITYFFEAGGSGQPGSFLPSGTGSGISGSGFSTDGQVSSPYFGFLKPQAYVDGGFGNMYWYGSKGDGGFGGGQSPLNKQVDLTSVIGYKQFRPTIPLVSGGLNGMAISDDANTLLASVNGYTNVYTYNGTSWVSTNLLTHTDSVVAMSADGSVWLINGDVWRNGSFEIQLQYFVLTSIGFDITSISRDGNTVAIIYRATGTVTLKTFSYSGGSWSSDILFQETSLYIYAYHSCVMSADGNTIAMFYGIENGFVNVYRRVNGLWSGPEQIYQSRGSITLHINSDGSIITLSGDGANRQYSNGVLSDVDFGTYALAFSRTDPNLYAWVDLTTVRVPSISLEVNVQVDPAGIDFTRMGSNVLAMSKILTPHDIVFLDMYDPTTTCTANTAVDHGYPHNYQVQITGTQYFNGTWDIVTTSSNTFTFQAFGGPTVTSGYVSGTTTGISGGGGYTGSPGDGVSGATCYLDVSVQNFTDLGPTSNTSGHVTIQLTDPPPLQKTVTWNKTWTTKIDVFVPPDTKASSVAFGNGTYVAVTNNGLIPVLYSYDGTSWKHTDVTGAIVAPWVSVAYGNGLFVAVSIDARRMISNDGVIWTIQTHTPMGRWRSVTYGNGLFVAVNPYNTDIPFESGLINYNPYGPAVITSPDGINWTIPTTPTGGWSAVTYGNGLIVAVGQNIYYSGAMASPDGINWTLGDAPGGFWYSVAYGNGLFVAMSPYGPPSVMTSPDGINWTTRTAPFGSWYLITYGNGLFVAVSPEGPPHVMTSPDGINWTTRTTPSGFWYSVTYGNGLFVALAVYGPPSVMTSPDGINWTTQTAPSGVWGSITYGNGLFVAVAFYGPPFIMTSPDGINWTTRTAPSGVWFSSTYGNGLFVVGSQYGPGFYNFGYPDVFMSSPDGINWTESSTLFNYSCITYGNGKFVAVTHNTSSFGATDYSTDGIVWNRGNLPVDAWSTVSYGNGLFFALTNTGTNTYAYSSDGITWTTSSEPSFTDAWTGSTYGNGVFVAVSLNGRIIYSQTGTSWIEGGGLGVSSNCITYGQGYFVTPSSEPSISNVMISTDCVTWSNVHITSGASYTGATHGTPYGFIFVSPTDRFEIGLTPTFFVNTNQIVDATQLNYTQWSQLTYGNNVFVTGGAGRLQSTNDNGQTWSRTLISNTVTSVTYSHDLGTFLAFGNEFVDGTYTSKDGTNWTQYQNLPLTIPSKNASITWGSDKFVAVLDGDSNVLYSRDGTNWNVTTQGTQMDSWTAVTYGKGQFVACSSSNAMTSSDGLSWSIHQAFVSNYPEAMSLVTYGNGLFVAIGPTDFYTTPVMTSPDGIIWTISSTPIAGLWYSITYGNGLFVALGGADGYFHPYSLEAIMTSPDGINWTVRSAPLEYWRSITYGNGLFVAVGYNVITPGVMTSPDGINWTERVSPGGLWSSVTYGNGLFVATANASYPGIMSSPDGINWTVRSQFSVLNGIVTYGNGVFVNIGTDISFMISYDGINWDFVRPAPYRYWNSVTYGNSLFVAVSSSSVATSPDGINWKYRSVPSGDWNSVAYGNGLFVAVSPYGTRLLMTSPDGITWTSSPLYRRSGVSVAYGNNVYVSVSSYGALYSYDGSTWNVSQNAPVDTWVSVVYGNGYFMAVSQNGTYPVMYSQDGIHWYTNVSDADAINWYSIAYGNNTFLAIDRVGGSFMKTQISESF